MAIRTANKRAYLRGEGEKRQEWGITTVVVNSRQGGCPKCAEYIGKVFIDDVYSGGKKSDGDYPLLSTAIQGGLFHPNCKDGTSTYYEGITTLKPVTAKEKEQMKRLDEAEQKKSNAEKQAEKCGRIANYSLDDGNKRIYVARAKRWKAKAEKLSVHRISELGKETNNAEKIIKNAAEAIENSGKSGIINYKFDHSVKKAVQEAFDVEYATMVEKFGKISTINKVEPLIVGSSYGEYYDHSGTLAVRFANKKDCLSALAQKAAEMKKAGQWSSAHPMHIFRHEIGHAIQAEHAKNDLLWSKKLDKISKIMEKLNEPITGFKGEYSVSKYAMVSLDEFISECIAESMTRKARSISKKVVKIILED